MAIIVKDASIGIEVPNAYVKISSFTVNEGDPENGEKRYNVVVSLDFYPDENKRTIYRKEQFSLDGLTQLELSHSSIYGIIGNLERFSEKSDDMEVRV